MKKRLRFIQIQITCVEHNLVLYELELDLRAYIDIECIVKWLCDRRKRVNLILFLNFINVKV